MNPLIKTILEDYKIVLGTDFNIYKNHVSRIYSFMILIDTDVVNHDKYAIAAVFHDIGIWTDSFNYLKPSIKLAEKYLIENNQANWVEEISLMISFHHKMSPYKGKFQKTVETFRQADWIDVSMGFMRFEMEKQDYVNGLKLYSNKGFHLFLVKQMLKYFPKNPLNPLPMFKS